MMDHGFTKKVVESKEYLDMLEKIITYIPQTSIIGRLLTHKEKIRIIKIMKNKIEELLRIWKDNIINKEKEEINLWKRSLKN